MKTREQPALRTLRRRGHVDSAEIRIRSARSEFASPDPEEKTN